MHHLVRFMMALLMGLLWVSQAAAVGVEVTDECRFDWVAPTQKTDGTPAGPLKEYQLFLATSSGAYALGTPAKVIPAPATTALCSGIGTLVDGQQYFAAVRVVSVAGQISALSAEVAFVFKKTPVGPKPVEQFKVIDIDVQTGTIRLQKVE